MKKFLIHIIITSIIGFLAMQSGYSQNAGVVEFHGIVKSKSFPVSKCLIKVYENNRLTQHKKTLANGYFKLDLFLNSSYEIEFSKEGKVPYRIELSTVVPGTGNEYIKSKILAISLKDLSFDTDFNTSTYTEYSINLDGKFKKGKTITKVPTVANNNSAGTTIISDANSEEAKLAAQEIIMKAKIEAEKIIEEANKNKNTIDERIRKLRLKEDSIGRVASKKVFTENPDIETENISAEKLAELEAKNEELKKLLAKDNLVADDSLLIMENRLVAKEMLFEDLKKQLESAETSSDSTEMLRLRSVISKLEPELKAIRVETEKLSNITKLNQAKLNERNLQLLIVAAAVLFLLILAFILFRMFANKKKSNKNLAVINTKLADKNTEITKQKEEIEKQGKALETSYEEIKSSINYASTIQNAMLPDKQDLQRVLNAFILFRPKDVVSGDFYWSTTLPATETSTEKKFIAAVDCTGHGVPGAFMSMIGNRLLNEIVNERKINSPARILEELDKGIVHSLKQETSSNKDGMDVCLCRVENLPNGQTQVLFCGAKRPLFHYIKATRKVERLRGTRKSIGGIAKRPVPFIDQSFIFNQGDEIFLCSDGIIDQNNPARESFGTKRFTSLIQLIAGKSATLQRNMVNDALVKFMDNEEQRDDIIVIGVKN